MFGPVEWGKLYDIAVGEKQRVTFRWKEIVYR